MFNKIAAVLILLNTKFLVTSTEEILILQPFGSVSHRQVTVPIAVELGKRGHLVTFVSTYSFEGLTPENVTEITYPEFVIHYPILQNITADLVKFGFGPGIFKRYYNYHLELCRNFFESGLLQNWILHGKKFRLVIIDSAFHECLVPLWYLVGQNLVIINTGVINPWVREYMNIPTPYAYVPFLHVPYNQHMNFFQRLTNTIYFLISKYIIYLSNIYFYDIVLRYFPDILPFEQSLRNISLVLVNHDPVVVPASPSLPTVIPIGGIQCRSSLPLPDGKLKNFVDNSGQDGFILFSFGSIINGNLMEKKLINTFVSAFAQIKQKVIWKFESELSNLSSNVMTSTWVPQQDLLGHPKIRAFINHGGLQSTQEAIYHRVPQISFPLTTDQPSVVAITAGYGIAIKMDLESVTVDELIQAIDKAINDQEMCKKIEYYSEVFRDRDEVPLKKAIYWIEYVIRYHGALHLQTPAGNLNFFQYHLLDVSAFIAAIILSVVSLYWIGMKKLIKVYFPKVINQIKNKSFKLKLHES